jgi:hypothetical protein
VNQAGEREKAGSAKAAVTEAIQRVVPPRAPPRLSPLSLSLTEFDGLRNFRNKP